MKKDEFGLTPKQRGFCDTLLADSEYNQARAYMEVYECKESVARINASRTLTNANVQRYLELRKNERRERLERRLQYSLDQALIHLDEIRANAMQKIPLTKRVNGEEVPVLDDQGNAVMDMLDRREAIKTIELLGKHYGGWSTTFSVDMRTIRLEDIVLAEAYGLQVEDYMRRKVEGTLPATRRPPIDGQARVT